MLLYVKYDTFLAYGRPPSPYTHMAIGDTSSCKVWFLSDIIKHTHYVWNWLIFYHTLKFTIVNYYSIAFRRLARDLAVAGNLGVVQANTCEEKMTLNKKCSIKLNSSWKIKINF